MISSGSDFIDLDNQLISPDSSVIIKDIVENIFTNNDKE